MVNGVCYVRVSTENQLENYSIEEQTDRLRAFCKAKDINIKQIYTDGGYSGGNMNRPALKQMIHDIENGGINTVIVYKLDRLSRSQKDTLTLIEDTFIANKVDFISVNENFDTSTPFGRAMIGILSVFAQLEKDQITERFTMGRIGRAKNGYYHGGSISPTGYDYINGNLIVNEYEALQVHKLFERFSKGYTLHNCWLYMQKNYVTKYGAWTSESLVRNVLKNNVYIGKIKFKGNVYEGNHKPIISDELFYQVQAIFEQSSQTLEGSRRFPFKAGNLLTSLIYCGNCGARYHCEHGNYSCYSRTKGDKKYIKDPNCKNKKWKIDELDSLLIGQVTHFDLGISIVKTNHPISYNYENRIKELETQIDKLIHLYQIGNIPFDTISSKINILTKEKECLEHQPKESALPYESKIDYQEKLTELLTYGDLQTKRACLTQIIEKITIHGNDVDIKIRA